MFLRWEVAEGREPSWQAALIFCPPCRLAGKLSDEGVGYMAELQDVEWNSDTKGEDKSSVLSLGRGAGGHMGGNGGSWDSSRDSGWLRRKEIRFLVRSWMAHLSLVPDPQRIYPKSVIFSWNIKKSL